jgi:hypothetical protein
MDAERSDVRMKSMTYLDGRTGDPRDASQMPVKVKVSGVQMRSSLRGCAEVLYTSVPDGGLNKISKRAGDFNNELA